MADFPVCVQVLFLRDDHVLLAKRQNSAAERQWCAPGGSLEHGEDAVTAALRETREEIGIQLRSSEVEMAAVLHMNAWQYGVSRIVFTFQAHAWDGEPSNKEPHVCSELQWFPVDELPSATMTSTRVGIDLARRGERFAAIGWNTAQ
ncbi:NUDIX domain-containing protein [Nocardia acidivorans]|uniref:NUDIX domain-containing protein n=1 Tax=Nocardia acidivorans TaxID=404580 RepID=UPI00082B0633|nr:NUDIX domain-containing protein [Nocardia acidivorans]